MNELITAQVLEEELKLLSDLIEDMQRQEISTRFLSFAIEKKDFFQRRLEEGSINDNAELFDQMSAVYNILYKEYRACRRAACNHIYETINGVVRCRKCGKPF